MPNQPGMAGGGLTSIPLNMHHDFAAGGIIAFAEGGEPDPYALKKPITEEEAFEKQKAAEAKYGFGNDPYAEAKRRYAEIEAKQREREKSAGSDRFWAGLAAYGSAGPKGFAQAAGNASKVMQGMESQQQAQSEANAMKMAELHSLWGKEQEAMNRARYAAVMGKVKEEEAALREIAELRHKRDQVEAQKTTAAASTKQAETSSQREAREAKEQEVLTPAKLALLKAQAAREGRPDDFQQRYKLYQTDPNAFQAMYGNKLSGQQTSREEAIKNLVGRMGGAFTMLALKPEGLAQQEALIKQEMNGGAAPKPTGGKNPYSDKSDAELKAALGIK
jgi:hypothetical protein